MQSPKTLADISFNPLGASVGVEEVSAVLLVTSQQTLGQTGSLDQSQLRISEWFPSANGRQVRGGLA